jgi:primosomal protein N' (replication factor Y)
MCMYAEIILPQKIGEDKETLTYSVPEGLNLEIGNIVEVPLIKRKVKGVVYNLTETAPPFKTKDITGIVENAPHLRTWQIPIIKWISGYYFSPLFRSLKPFLPAGFVKKKKIREATPDEVLPFMLKEKHTLTQAQEKVMEEIAAAQQTGILLHGITGSGKTEIYLRTAAKQIEKGRQVCLLIPEISLTPQTAKRVRDHFKEKCAIIHSQLTPKQKEKEWLSIFSGEAKIIIGSRSAIFAPFKDLGLIIIDEEHDSCYKQDQSPRYNTLDVALKIAEALKIKVLIGSATPSLETYFRAKKGEFALLELHERTSADGTHASLPKTQIVDLREEIKKKNFSIFSEALQKKIKEKLEKKEQILLFLNRRGSASAVVCRECGFTAECPSCDLPLTYHQKFSAEGLIFNQQKLICHHCGRIENVPTLCPVCQSHYIKYIGLGTQRVEDEINKLFPMARVIRADRDTTSTKEGFGVIYEKLKNHEVDIVIGTQMIAIGLHLPKVNLVGVVLADLGLTIPNFRNSERTFQLITQVSGRAGRISDMGEVIIQTYVPDHYTILLAAMHDFEAFYKEEIEHRKELSYPPYSRLILLNISDFNARKAEGKAQDLFNFFTQINNNENSVTVYPAMIARLKNRYRWHVLLSGKNPEYLLKKTLAENPKILREVIIDVDPLSTV